MYRLRSVPRSAARGHTASRPRLARREIVFAHTLTLAARVVCWFVAASAARLTLPLVARGNENAFDGTRAD
jgi:hypothetical protein